MNEHKLMIKVIYIVILTFVLFFTCDAQDSTWQFGIQGGANLSYFAGDNPYGTEAYGNFGLNFGFYYKYMISQVSSIYLELRYINKGAQWGSTWLPIAASGTPVRKYDLELY